jgi:hypothetical protein
MQQQVNKKTELINVENSESFSSNKGDSTTLEEEKC